MSLLRSPLLPVVACAALFFAGCSDEPKAPPRFKIDPESAAQEAMKLYDTNQDGKIDAHELEASPPLRELLLNLKSRESAHPDSLTSNDIAACFHSWIESPANLMSRPILVYLDGKPLAEATVEFEPEPFLGASYKKHRCTTDNSGKAMLDPEIPGYPGIYVGLYRVRIFKKADSKETVPERYNTKTILGVDFSSDARDSDRLGTFDLKNK